MPYRQSKLRISISVLITLIIALALAALVLVQSAQPAGAMAETEQPIVAHGPTLRVLFVPAHEH